MDITIIIITRLMNRREPFVQLTKVRCTPFARLERTSDTRFNLISHLVPLIAYRFLHLWFIHTPLFLFSFSKLPLVFRPSRMDGQTIIWRVNIRIFGDFRLFPHSSTSSSSFFSVFPEKTESTEEERKNNSGEWKKDSRYPGRTTFWNNNPLFRRKIDCCDGFSSFFVESFSEVGIQILEISSADS